MAEGRIIKWLYKDDNMRIYIIDAYDIVVKEKLQKNGKSKFEMTAVIKRHNEQLAIWFPPDGNREWTSAKVRDAAHIRDRYEIPLSDEALELYDAVLTSGKLIR